MNTVQLASQNLGGDSMTRTSVLDTLVYIDKPRAATASKARQNFLPIDGSNFLPIKLSTF